MPVHFHRWSFRLLPTLAVLFLTCSADSAPTTESSTQESSTQESSVPGPKAIFIIRHGEKPDSDNDPDLSPDGFKRADALAHVIPDHFCVPDFIFATAPGKHSNREMETVQPLAKALHKDALDPYHNKDFANLAHDLLTQPQYSGKTVLVCWHHGEIPSLAKALGAADAPKTWNPQVFDRVWLLTYADGKVQFQNLPEKAMPGDEQN